MWVNNQQSKKNLLLGLQLETIKHTIEIQVFHTPFDQFVSGLHFSAF